MKIPIKRRFSASFNLIQDDLVTRSSNQAYGWHFQYLTVIGLSLSTVTFAVALLADVTLSRRLFLVKNLLSVCSAPLEVLISVLYWGLRLVSLTPDFDILV
jgi:hypothetical protein